MPFLRFHNFHCVITRRHAELFARNLQPTSATIACEKLTIKVNFRHVYLLACLLLLLLSNALCQDLITVPSTASLGELCSNLDARNDFSPPLGHTPTNGTDTERSADLALVLFCRSALQGEATPIQVERAASAVDSLLEAGEVQTATSIVSSYSSKISPDLTDTTSSHLHFVAAQARLLSYQDRNLKALDLRVKLQAPLELVFGERSSEAIENRLRIANLHVELGELSTGLAELEELTTVIQSQLFTDVRLWRLTRESRALALAVNGSERQALDELRALRADITLKFGSEDERVIDIDEEIASVLMRKEEIEEAVKIESNVFLWRNEHLRPNSQKALQTLWRLGYFLVASRREKTARAVLGYVARRLKAEGLNGSNRLLLETMSRIASIDAKEGYFDSALEIWRQVYEGEKALLGDAATDTQLEATNYAVALMHSGKIGPACDLLKKSLQNQERWHPNDIWSNDFMRISNAQCLLETSMPISVEKARQSLQKTFEEILQHSSETSPHALFALAMFAKATTLSGQRSEAKKLLIRLVNATETFRGASTSGVLGRDSIFSAWIEGRSSTGDEIPGYRDLALMHAQDGELERALRISELARDRTLRDRFAEQEWRRTQLPAYARTQLDELLDRIQDFDERIAVESDIVQRIRLESERTLAVGERGRLERELRDQLHIAPPFVRPPTLDELRAQLAADTALVSVLHSGGSWWALVILRNEPARFVEFRDPDLGRIASAWVRRLRGEPVRVWPLAGDRVAIDPVRPEGAEGRYLTSDELARRLSDRLLLPLKKAAGKARHLVFVGDDELVGIPLQALPLDSGLALDRFEVSYAPSLTTYARWQGPARTDVYPLDLLAIGAIDYQSIAPPVTDDPIVIGVQIAEDHPLPFARAELDAISALFPARRTSTWTGAQANRSTLRLASRAGELQRYRYVHFATHAWAQPDQPESSAIVLAGANGEVPTRRALTAAELAGLQMGSELIVLSACDTGVGHFEHGQGLLGLAYAGLAAGNRAALLSLWPVADDTTAAFMEHLYAKLRGRMDPVSALAATQREFRRSDNPRLSDPLVWAPFILYGGY